VENIGSYIVDSGGKRLRPVLVLLSALANNYQSDESNHIKLAAVIEFIHTATLLHDDVVDVSALRRGRETANEIWGNAPSVLVGDFLYSRAFQMLVEVADLDIMRIFADATNVISEGEVQQMANAGNPNIDEDTYMQVIYRKTAKLFEAGMECGALLAEADKNAMNLFGMHLGDVAVIGKNIGDDLNEGKMTLPLIYARDHADPAESQIIQQAIENRSAENFDQILKIVSKTGGIDYSLSRATEHSVLASNALTALPESPYKQVLSKLASFAVSRDV
jgi:octaprenyl-diphosphate synthase